MYKVLTQTDVLEEKRQILLETLESNELFRSFENCRSIIGLIKNAAEDELKEIMDIIEKRISIKILN